MARPVDEQGNYLYSFNTEFYRPKDLVSGVIFKNSALAIPLVILEQEKLVQLEFENQSLIAGFYGG